MTRHSMVPAVVIIVTATKTSPRGSPVLAMWRVMVIGKPSAAIVASRVTPEVTPENVPTAAAEYL